MLETAENLIQDGLFDEACGQLSAVYKKTDGLPKPPDFVTGQAAQELADKISDLIEELNCPGDL